MHYVTRISHRMQKHKFGVMCPGTLFVETAPGPPEHEKLCIDISRPDAHKCTTWPKDRTGCKTQVRRNVSRRAFCGNRSGCNRAWKIVRRCLMPQTHQNALYDPQIAPDAKTTSSVWRVLASFLWKPHRAHPSMKNSASKFHAPNEHKCIM
jgi:hypothetical protein